MDGRTGCAESEGLCDLPFPHTAILMLWTPKRSAEFMVIGVTVSVSLWMRLSPLARRLLVQNWTADETTPSHHYLQKIRKKRGRERKLVAWQLSVFCFCEVSGPQLSSEHRHDAWPQLASCWSVLFNRMWCWILSTSICRLGQSCPECPVLLPRELMACVWQAD